MYATRCSEYPKPDICFLRQPGYGAPATAASRRGFDGTAHQWITPAGENTPYPEGVSVRSVTDMAAAGCDGDRDGCMTFYYTNQQSARLLFYHDHLGVRPAASLRGRSRRLPDHG